MIILTLTKELVVFSNVICRADFSPTPALSPNFSVVKLHLKIYLPLTGKVSRFVSQQSFSNFSNKLKNDFKFK